ncbi:hypothetical protein KSF78_0002762, partial [Schistosoma japonicum]
DASFGASTYHLTLLDCLFAVAKRIDCFHFVLHSVHLACSICSL